MCKKDAATTAAWDRDGANGWPILKLKRGALENPRFGVNMVV